MIPKEFLRIKCSFSVEGLGWISEEPLRKECRLNLCICFLSQHLQWEGVSGDFSLSGLLSASSSVGHHPHHRVSHQARSLQVRKQFFGKSSVRLQVLKSHAKINEFNMKRTALCWICVSTGCVYIIASRKSVICCVNFTFVLSDHTSSAVRYLNHCLPRCCSLSLQRFGLWQLLMVNNS